jgi:ubiquinone/menaquinone biosynthesis C-methylase UbiE
MNCVANYDKQLDQELSNYRNVDEVHALPPIFHYWSNKYLLPKLRRLGFESISDVFLQYITRISAEKRNVVCKIVSIGAGNCDFEIALAKSLLARRIANFHFECLEINPSMLVRGERHAQSEQIEKYFTFSASDVNEWRPKGGFEIALANHSLHHVVQLEALFDTIKVGLAQGGAFVINDMIGRNGHMRWPEALEIVERFWKYLPRSHKYNHQLKRVEEDFVNWDCSREGFEGIRAQDIIPELLKTYQFDLILGFANAIDVFIDRGFGPNFDVNCDWDRLYIDQVHDADQELLDRGQLKPTHMVAALMREDSHPKVYKHLTPAFCVRWPEGSSQ